MKIDCFKHPLKIEYFDWHIIPPEIKHKIIIDTTECLLTARNHITSTHMVNIQEFEIEEDDMETIVEILCLNNLRSYLDMPDDNKTEKGYRDGWRTHFRVIYKDIPSFSGTMGEYFAENPLEQVLHYLREHYPYIEQLKNV